MFKLKQLDNLIQFSKWWWTVSWITFRYKAHVHRDDMCPSAHSTFGVLFITVALLWLNERWCEKQRDGVSSMKFYFLPFPLLLGGFWGRCSVCWCVRCCCVSYTMPVKTMPFFSFFFFSSPLAHLSGKQKCLLSVGGSAKDVYTQRKNKWGKKEKEKQQQQKKKHAHFSKLAALVIFSCCTLAQWDKVWEEQLLLCLTPVNSRQKRVVHADDSWILNSTFNILTTSYCIATLYCI